MLTQLLTMARAALGGSAAPAAAAEGGAGAAGGEVGRLTERLGALQAQLESLKAMEKERVTGCFEWMDGILVQALERGDWLVLDNVNLCNPTVLDRLNPLLEPGGVLMLNERGLVNGQVTMVKPHPNFRLFLCMDPQRGEISRAMRNRGVEISLLNSQLGPKDLERMLGALGLPGAALPRIMIDHHQHLVEVAGQMLGPPLTVRHLIKWAKMLVATVPRGVPLALAWPAATELVYAACGSSERWRHESSAASKRFLIDVPLRVLDSCPHEVMGLVRGEVQLRHALLANVLRDSMALQELLREHLRAHLRASPEGHEVNLASLSAFHRQCLDLARLLQVPAGESAPAVTAGETRDRQVEGGIGGAQAPEALQRCVMAAVRLFLGQTSPADWELRMARIGGLAQCQPEGEVRQGLLAATAALQVLAQHPALHELMRGRRERAARAEEAEAELGRKGAVPLRVDEVAFDLRGDAVFALKTRDLQVIIQSTSTRLLHCRV